MMRLISPFLINRAKAHIPQIEWNFSKQKGGNAPHDQSAEIRMLTQQLASLQAQLASLGQAQPPYAPPFEIRGYDGFPIQGMAVLPPLAAPETVMQGMAFMPPAAPPQQMMGQQMMGQQMMMPQQQMMPYAQPAPQMIPVMPVMMPAPMQPSQSMFDLPLRLLRNMSLTITPITQMIKATSGGKKKRQRDKPVKETSKTWTKVKETFSPMGLSSRTVTNHSLDHGMAKGCGAFGCDDIMEILPPPGHMGPPMGVGPPVAPPMGPSRYLDDEETVLTGMSTDAAPPASSGSLEDGSWASSIGSPMDAESTDDQKTERGRYESLEDETTEENKGPLRRLHSFLSMIPIKLEDELKRQWRDEKRVDSLVGKVDSLFKNVPET